ncbi:hypothetical protein [Lacrimispora celerecrescens]|uniref:hypothetical protein n=1 Tax=Lacrimispora celerecrescens TaxID=29354 RepID=UPI0012FDA5D5|nr:hypothetical protein [Lacrimispora celerecrescens]
MDGVTGMNMCVPRMYIITMIIITKVGESRLSSSIPSLAAIILSTAIRILTVTEL